jgi:hypothetical protein
MTTIELAALWLCHFAAVATVALAILWVWL